MDVPVGGLGGLGKAVWAWFFGNARVVMRFKGWSAREGRIVFPIQLGNDGPTIARQVVVEGYLDDEHVGRAEPPVDVEPNSPFKTLTYLRLARPEQADVAPGGHLNLHGRRLHAVARPRNGRGKAPADFEG